MIKQNGKNQESDTKGFKEIDENNVNHAILSEVHALGKCVLCKQWKPEVDAWQHLCNSCIDKCAYTIEDVEGTKLLFDSDMNLIGMDEKEIESCNHR